MARKKGRRGSTRRPFRFTEPHRQLSEGIKDLIRLYYIFKENKDFIPAMTSLLKTVTGTDFNYDATAKQFVNIQQTNRRIGFGNKQKWSFVNIMDGLQQLATKNIIYHCFPITWVDKIETSIEEPKLQMMFEQKIKIPETLINKCASEALRKQERKLKESALGRVKRNHANEKDVKCETLSLPYRIYRLRYFTWFGEFLLRAKPTETTFNEIPSITFNGWTSFIQIARSLLVNYHVSFGNYERIKVCGYEPCSKLFFEEKAGEKSFCSTLCRVKAYQASKPPEKLRCKAKWNRRIDSHYAKYEKLWKDKLQYEKDPKSKKPKYKELKGAPVHVYLHHCEACNDYSKGDVCQKLKNLNKEAFEAFHQVGWV